MTLRIDLQLEGLEELADAYQNAPETVARIAEQAGQEAIPVLGGHIGAFTPVVTGYLLSTEEVHLEGPFNLIATADAPYAGFVHERVPYIDSGVGAAEAEVDTIYEAAMDRLAEDFASGR